MVKPDWGGAENELFEQSQRVIRRFAEEHPSESFSLFAYTVDSEFTGVGLNFDTAANSLQKAKAHQQYEVGYRNRMFTKERSWEHAQYFVANPSRQIDDFNRDGAWQYDVIAFVHLAAWDEYCHGSEETPELMGRIIMALWRVTDRLIEVKAFDRLRRAVPFRLGYSFHDDNLVVMRILDWPTIVEEGSA
jgi:hypothetical protein